ncbi:cytochrome P450 [Apiospora phragmitis]|uniref:Cytochrome P450 n=1 Tax=Apiospora phragmitis TaxID=2905665 RepID=A0ABR1W5U4_9PEZI
MADSIHQFRDRMLSSPLEVAGKASVVSFTMILVYLAGLVLYNLFLHPLRNLNQTSGASHKRMLALHLRYGPVVRVAPEILSVNHPDGMKQVRGHRHAGQPEHGKDPLHVAANNADNILGAGREEHARFRRILAHVFSAQAMHEQEPLIRVYLDKLFAGLKRGWYNWTTFDIIGDLSFGAPFGIKNMSFTVNANRYPFIAPLLQYFVPAEVKTKWAEHKELSIRSLRKRLDTDTDRPDFVDKMMHARGTKGGEMTFEEMASHSALLIIAGSETTATLLSGATYQLATHPEALAKLTAEVRGAFASEDDINIAGTSNLPYLLAVLDESLRIYPPIAKGGDTIIDHFVPEDTIVEIWQWTLYNNPNYINEPESFVPERWLGDPRFKSDRLDAVQPFSVGPRNCIGKNLAYAEMRMILARIIWNFDLSITPQSRNWAEDNKIYFLWEKPPLEVALTPRRF